MVLNTKHKQARCMFNLKEIILIKLNLGSTFCQLNQINCSNYVEIVRANTCIGVNLILSKQHYGAIKI